MTPTARSEPGVPHVGRKHQQGRSPAQTRGSTSASLVPDQQVIGYEYGLSYHHPQPFDHSNPSKKFKSDISVQARSPQEFGSPASPTSQVGQGGPPTSVNHCPETYSSFWPPVPPGLNTTGSPINPSHAGAYRTDFAPPYTSHPLPFSNSSAPPGRPHAPPGPPPHTLHSRHISTSSRFHSQSSHSALPDSQISAPESFQSPTSVPAFSGITTHPGHAPSHAHPHQQSGHLIGYSEAPHYSPVEAYSYHSGGPDLHLHSPDSQSHIWSLGIPSSFPHVQSLPEAPHSSAESAVAAEYCQTHDRQPQISHHATQPPGTSNDLQLATAYVGPHQVQQAAQFFVQPSAPLHPWPTVPSGMAGSDDERWRWEVNPGPEDQQKRELELELAPRETLGHPSQQPPELPIDPESLDEDGSACDEGVEDEAQSKKLANTKRRKFSSPEREETGRTRNIGACVRCKIQKIRCDGSSTCNGCYKVAQNFNKKVIHHVPCKRWKMQEVVWTRNGGLGLTKRWQGVDVKNIPWNTDIKVSRTVGIKIFFSSHNQGGLHRKVPESYLCSTPLEIEVRKFDPQEGDVLNRYWTKRNGISIVTKEVKMPPYCLVDIEQTRNALNEYFDTNAPEALKQRAEDENAEPMVRAMFKLALAHWRSLPEEGAEKKLMGMLFQLWFAMRFSTGSAFLDDSDPRDTLDMAPETDEEAPLCGKVSVPRMITAQIDSINAKYITKKLSKQILAQLEAFFRSNNPELWLTLFLSTFILLHEVGHSTRDRFRHARQSGYPERYTQPEFVQDLHHGANIVLIHWQYYKSNVSPASSGWRVDTRPREELDAERAASAAAAIAAKKNKTGEREKKPKSKVLLTPAHRVLVETWWARMEGCEAEFSRMLPGGAEYYQSGAWEDPMYYVYQIFLRTWRPIDGYVAPGKARAT